MGAPAHISIPAPASSFPSPRGSMYSPSETESSLASSSPSLPVSSSSSFAHQDSSFAPASTESQSRQEITIHQKRQDVPQEHMGDGAQKHIKKCTCRKSPKGSKRASIGSCKSCKMGVSMRKACCRCAGAFAADCAALCCCPCAIVSLLSFILVELPSTLAKRMIAHLKKRLSVKDSSASCDHKRDDSQTMFTPTRSQREPCKGAEAQAVHLIRFDTENLLKHFDAEHVGFGCLSQKRE